MFHFRSFGKGLCLASQGNWQGLLLYDSVISFPLFLSSSLPLLILIPQGRLQKQKTVLCGNNSHVGRPPRPLPPYGNFFDEMPFFF